jgi:arginine/ornithine transport system substrate-binding protein
MKRFISACMLFLFVLSVNIVQAKEWKVIRIGIETAYPPFSYVTPEGELGGFDIEIAKALVKEMGAEIKLVPQDWDGIIPALYANKYDAIVASMGITEERQQKVAFTNKYYISPSKFYAKKGLIDKYSEEAIKGKKIAVQRATAHDSWLSAKFGDQVDIKRYPTMDEALLDLKNGRADMLLADKIQIFEAFAKKPEAKDFEFVGPDLDDPKWFGDGVGIALRKKDADLVKKFNDAILAIRANGTYKKINDKYFEFDIYGE